jgi:hypothetical protein
MGSPPQHQPAPALGDEATAAPATRPVIRADVHNLLSCYREALELAADPPPSRRTPFAPLTRLLCRVRPRWGLQRMVVEHIRGRIALIDQRYCLRLALGEHDPNDPEDRAALALFTASLPPPRAKFWLALPVLAAVAVSQVLLALLLRGREGVPKTAEGTLLPQKVIQDLTAAFDLNPAHFAESLNTLLHGSPKVTALVAGILTLAVYIVWRPLVPAFRLKRIIFGMPGAIDTRVARSVLGARARRLGVHDEEVALFAALGMRAPSDAALDLWVKGALVAILAALAALMFVPPADAVTGAVLLAIAILRLTWLGRSWHGRTLRGDLVTPHVHAVVTPRTDAA